MAGGMPGGQRRGGEEPQPGKAEAALPTPTGPAGRPWHAAWQRPAGNHTLTGLRSTPSLMTGGPRAGSARGTAGGAGGGPGGGSGTVPDKVVAAISRTSSLASSSMRQTSASTRCVPAGPSKKVCLRAGRAKAATMGRGRMGDAGVRRQQGVVLVLRSRQRGSSQGGPAAAGGASARIRIQHGLWPAASC